MDLTKNKNMIMELTQDDINEINNSGEFDSWYQGIYKEAYGVPNDMKEHAVYMRWNTGGASGGASGGSCWGDEAEHYDGDDEPDFVVLTKVLEKVCPTLSFSHYKKIENLITSNYETDYEYYGNYTDYQIKFIPLSEIYNCLVQLGY